MSNLVLYFSLNVLVTIILLLSPFYWSQFLRLGIINPVTIMAIIEMPLKLAEYIFGPIFILGTVEDFGYNFALAMTNLRFFVELLIILFLIQSVEFYKASKLSFSKIVYGSRELIFAARFFIFLGISTFILLAELTGGLYDWLSNVRISYIEKRSGYGSIYALSINFISLSYFFYGLASKSVKSFTRQTIIFFILIFVYGSKGLFLTFFTFYLINIWRMGYSFSFFRTVTGLFFVAIFMISNLILGSSTAELVQIINYFDMFINASIFYNDRLLNNLPLYDGLIWSTSFWEYVPRGLYPEKPYVYGILHVVEEYYPGGPASGNTPMFSGEVTKYADYGILGVIFLSFFNLGLFLKVYMLLVFSNYINSDSKNIKELHLVVMLVLFAPSFGIYFPTILFLFLLLFVILFMRFTLIKLK